MDEKMMPVILLLAIVLSILIGYFSYSLLNPSVAPASPGAAAGTQQAWADEQQVKTTMATYLNDLLKLQGAPANAVFEVTGISKQNGMYALTYAINEAGVAVQNGTLYTSPDGKQLFTYPPIDTTVALSEITATEEVKIEVQKSDKPVVELFVMSHCPYGTQVEKAMLPVLSTLGDKVDFDVKFVYYVMHGETEVKEQLNQHCIQTQQEDKYIQYLTCFLNESNGAACLDDAQINKTMLAECTNATDAEFQVLENLQNTTLWLNGRYPRFNVHSDLNTQYGVGGSPTLVINGQQAGDVRDPAGLLDLVCAYFNVPPAECNAELSTASPSPGFGYDAGSGTASTGSCG